MTQTEATAEVLWMAFRSLSREARDTFMGKMVADRAIRRELEDLFDLALAADRADEPTRPLEEVLAEMEQ